MPNHTKFMKDILSNKYKLEKFNTFAFIEKCYYKRHLPSKLKDPKSFYIPHTIGQCNFEKALFDLRASVNLMPLLIYRKLDLRKVKLTTVSLLLAKWTIKHLRGILEDVLLKVDKFIFLVNFITLDMEKDQEIPIILR